MLKEEADGSVRVSLRSLGDVDVQRHRRRPRRGRPPLRGRVRVDRSTSRRSSRASAPRSDAPARRERRARCMTASSSSTSRRAARRTTSSPSCARSTGSAGSVTPARSIPTPPACCSSGSVAPRACCATCRRRARRTAGAIVFGIATSTLDAAGEVLDQRPMPLTRDDVERALPRFVGDIEQLPPMVSAVKVGGRRLHELARAGEEVERAPRPVHVDRFDVEAFEPGPYPEADVAGRVRQRHLRAVARRRPRRRARRLRAPRRAAPTARRLVHARRGAPARRHRGRSRRRGAAARRRDARPRTRRRRRRAGARGRRHGVSFAAGALAVRGDGPYALVGPDGDAARGLRAHAAPALRARRRAWPARER